MKLSTCHRRGGQALQELSCVWNSLKGADSNLLGELRGPTLGHGGVPEEVADRTARAVVVRAVRHEDVAALGMEAIAPSETALVRGSGDELIWEVAMQGILAPQRGGIPHRIV